MSFDFSPEQKMLRDNLSAALTQAVDANALVGASEQEVDALRRRVDEALFDMGLAAILVPEERGGLGLGLLTLVAASEVLGSLAAPTSVVRSALAAWLIAEAGDEAQRETWLPGLLNGDLKAAFAFAEADSGWAPDRWRMSDTPLSGDKHHVEGAADADLFIVALAGGKLALAPRDAGVRVDASAPLDLSRPGGVVAFDGAAAELLEGAGGALGRLMEAYAIVLAADAYGAGQRALTMTVDYAKERRQFDRPIGSFQALKHQLADAALIMSPSRFLAWRAAQLWDGAPSESARSAFLAKAYIPDVAVSTARAMVEAHGAIGYTWEYPLHLFLKRAMYDRVSWGTPAENRARAAALAGW